MDYQELLLLIVGQVSAFSCGYFWCKHRYYKYLTSGKDKAMVEMVAMYRQGGFDSVLVVGYSNKDKTITSFSGGSYAAMIHLAEAGKRMVINNLPVSKIVGRA